jgi:hypothetical protein
MSLKQESVYLVKVGKVYKIGRTKSPVGEKVSELQEGYSDKVTLVGSFPTTKAAKNISFFEKKFRIYKAKGAGDDLYSLPQQLINSVKDWFKSCVEGDVVILGKRIKIEPQPKENCAIRLVKPLPPFPEMDSFNELLATGCEMFSDEFNKRYMAMMEAAESRSPEEMEAHYDKWAKENMSPEKYEKLQKDMAMLRKRAADRQNRN